MKNDQEQEAAKGRRKAPKALQNSSLSKDGAWRTFKDVPCLAQYKGAKFYVRKRINGTVYRRSLETEVFTVARERISKVVDEILAEIANPPSEPSLSPDSPKTIVPVTVGDGIEKHRARTVAGPYKKQTHRYYETCHKRLKAIWPELAGLPIAGVTEDQCLAWATKERGEVSTNFFNNLLSFLRHALAAAIEMHKNQTGSVIMNPASTLKRSKKGRRGAMSLPDNETFRQVLQKIRDRGSRQAEDCIDLAEFLAYSGARVYSEAAWVTWRDVDWEKMELTFRGSPENGLKWRQPGETRVLGINKSLEVILRRLETKQPKRKPTDRILKVKCCDTQLQWACDKLEIPPLTHHKLRHWFGTRCAEEGVGPEVIGEFLGHRDRGVTALREYVEPSQKHVKKVALKLALN